MKVFIYWNLHKKCWSVKALEGEHKNRVIAHVTNFHLTDVTFKVSEAGRQRVIRERRKNVHAGLVGDWKGNALADTLRWPEIAYNPYYTQTFVDRTSGRSLTNASDVCGYSNRTVCYKE